VFFPFRKSVRCWAMRSPKPKRLSYSRTRIRPPSEGPRSLEIDLEGGVEGELEWSILFFTHWVLTSRASSSR
jgi:hypothetical protein